MFYHSDPKTQSLLNSVAYLHKFLFLLLGKQAVEELGEYTGNDVLVLIQRVTKDADFQKKKT